MKKIIILLIMTLLTACGGGSSSVSGIVIEGELEQGEAAVPHTAITRHAAGEKIGEVKICALGECSLTDDGGQFGFMAPADFKSGQVLFIINGHGIDTSTLINIPPAQSDVFLHLMRSGNNITVHHMMVDGKRVEHEESEHEGHSDSGSHTHSE